MEDFYDLVSKVMRLVDNYEGKEFTGLRYSVDNKKIRQIQRVRDLEGDHNITLYAEYPSDSTAWFGIQYHEGRKEFYFYAPDRTIGTKNQALEAFCNKFEIKHQPK